MAVAQMALGPFLWHKDFYPSHRAVIYGISCGNHYKYKPFISQDFELFMSRSAPTLSSTGKQGVLVKMLLIIFSCAL